MQPDPEPEADSSCCKSGSKRVDWIFYSSLVLVLSTYLAAYFILPSGSAFGEFIDGIREFIDAIWWGLLIGVIAVGILHYVPQSKIHQWLGKKSNFSGLLRAVVAGLLFDVCSHGILLVAMQLYRRGLSLGQTMAFLIASPWNSISLTLILIGLIGWKWTLVFIGLSVVIAIISGLLFSSLERCLFVPQNPYRQQSKNETEPGFLEQIRPLLSTPAGLGRWIALSLRESQMIIRWILLGTVFAALLRVLVHPDVLAHWFGPSLMGLGLTLVAATVIEVCSEGASPIAADLVNRAGSPGNSFTLLMAGVSTDYTEILALRETTNSWKISMLLPAITVPQILILGWILTSLS